ncbi:MAG: beta-propeller fold lactonase family protein, partial [Burkholderiales bacterium]|nr:beta-propeller fold lactonase family protein [Burkholderiales bacterium]
MNRPVRLKPSRVAHRVAASLALAAGLWLPAAHSFDLQANDSPRASLYVAQGMDRETAMIVAENEKIKEEEEFLEMLAASKVVLWGWRDDPPDSNPALPQPAPRANAEDSDDEGTLVRVPFTMPGGCAPQSAVAVHPNQRLTFFATAQGTQGFVCAYRIDFGTRTLTPAPGSPFATGGAPASAIAVDPSGTFLYSVATDDSGVTAFAIDAATGALTRIAGSPFATAPNPLAVVVDPTGRFVYVATQAYKTFASTISAYAIDADTGALAPLPGSPYAAPDHASALAVDPVGRYVYLTANIALKAYAVDAATGALAPIGTPVVGEGRIAVDPAGRFVYVEASEYIAPRTVEGVRA